MYPLRDTKLEPSFVFSSNHATVIENDELRKTKRGIEPKHLKEWGFLEVVGMSPDDYRKKCPSVRRINTVYISSASIFSSSFRISNEFWDGALLGLKISFACEGGSIAPFLPLYYTHPCKATRYIYIYIRPRFRALKFFSRLSIFLFLAEASVRDGFRSVVERVNSIRANSMNDGWFFFGEWDKHTR